MDCKRQFFVNKENIIYDDLFILVNVLIKLLFISLNEKRWTLVPDDSWDINAWINA